ncbi:energy transducer TonB [Chrysiogenes arsenatis]|uniref:energy transducer TonB n=1 Tax=Chrysiogenes arsenatis TaxID=309797 RepID=UPI000428A7E5|nr:energy transducer TonB [Chrysiogenes arsenatis]
MKKKSSSLLMPFALSIALHAAVLPLLPAHFERSGKPAETVTSVAVDLVRIVSQAEVPVVAAPTPVLAPPPVQKRVAAPPDVSAQHALVPPKPVVREPVKAVVDTVEVRQEVETAVEIAYTHDSVDQPKLDNGTPSNDATPVVQTENHEFIPAPFGSPDGARYARQVIPEYPRVARRMGWEGEVVVAARIGVDGTASVITIVQPSNHAPLDESARKAVEQSTYFPATRHGVSIETVVEIPMLFQLR